MLRWRLRFRLFFCGCFCFGCCTERTSSSRFEVVAADLRVSPAHRIPKRAHTEVRPYTIDLQGEHICQLTSRCSTGPSRESEKSKEVRSGWTPAERRSKNSVSI